MTAAEWNAGFAPGARVVVTLANGDCLTTRTASEAVRVGQHYMLQLDGRQGFYLLSWCQALEVPSNLADRRAWWPASARPGRRTRTGGG